MDTEHLKDFLTVAKYKNFSKAAEALYIGQPALSRRITGLEKQLGVQLFLRNSKTVELTAAGMVLQKEAGQILEQMEHLLEKLHAAGLGRGSVRVLTMGYISEHINQAIKRAAAAMPGCEVELDVLIPSAQGDGRQPVECDVAFVLGSCAESKAARKKTVLLEAAPYAFLMPAGHRLSRLDEVRPGDLSGETLFLLEVGKTPKMIQGLLDATAACGPRQAVFRKTLHSIALDVSMGKGIAFLPAFEAEKYTRLFDSLAYRPAAGLPVEGGVFLTWEEGRNPAADHFARTFLKLWEAAEPEQN